MYCCSLGNTQLLSFNRRLPGGSWLGCADWRPFLSGGKGSSLLLGAWTETCVRVCTCRGCEQGSE